MNACHVFSAAQLIEHNHLGFVGIFISTGFEQVFACLKVVEKDHRNSGGVCVDELACEGVQETQAEKRGRTYHSLCASRKPASTCTSLSAERHCQAVATALGQEEGVRDPSFSGIREQEQYRQEIRRVFCPSCCWQSAVNLPNGTW